MVGTKDGIMKARTIRRKASHGQRWNRTRLDDVTATPWNVGRDDQRDEDIKIEVPGQEEDVKEVPTADKEDRTQRRFYIKVKDVMEHGPTPECPGCARVIGAGRK